MHAQLFYDGMPLQDTLIFGELRILVPESVLRPPVRDDTLALALLESIEMDLGKKRFSDESGKLSLKFNNREGLKSRGTIQKMFSNFATGLYRGEIYRREELTVNGLDVFILDSIGYWDGEKEPSCIFVMIIYTESNTYTLELVYPEEDFDYSDAVKEEIIYSIKLKTQD